MVFDIFEFTNETRKCDGENKIVFGKEMIDEFFNHNYLIDLWQELGTIQKTQNGIQLIVIKISNAIPNRKKRLSPKMNLRRGKRIISRNC